MRLVHYSPRLIKKVRSVKHQNPDGWMKPSGLWLSDEGDYGWRQWCKDNNYGHHDEPFKYEYEVTIADDANVLRLTTLEDFDEFTLEYRKTIAGITWDCIYIDWERVAKKWQGIIITPYFWERRFGMSCSWYYAWDCASGCIWDAAAIKDFKLVLTNKRKQP